MNSTIERLTTALADRYRIERELGAGGMATVYLAEDLKHKRRVALKVLKPELAAVIGGERFIQEIATTAALQHPNILPLFDSGEADSFLFYVMPFIDGETLRSKLDRETQLGVDEAVRIACDVGEALHYAHSQGVVHRDIKPENILLANGRPIVADFGIALALSAAAGGRMTETGLSLGTPYYMSPEQATAEKEIGARSDVYSLASVLYEMLAGQPPHTGGSAQQIIMKIITENAASLTSHRKSVPINVAAAVARALEKLPADRFASAAEFTAALKNNAYAPTGATAAAYAPQQAKRTRALIGALAIATLVFGGVAASSVLRTPAAPPVIRYTMAIAAGQGMQQGILGINLAISPDGRRIVYVGGSDDQLWVRDRDKLDATPLPGTNGASNAFFSPDGEHIAFSAGPNFDLKVVPVAGGPPSLLIRPGAGSGGGGAWSSDGWIYFDAPAGLSRMRASGGQPEVVTPLDSANGEVGQAWPSTLPNGGLLFRSRRSLNAPEFDIVAYDPARHERHVLTKGLLARFVEPNTLVYVRADGAVLAAPFDVKHYRITGEAVPLFDGLMTKPFGSADIAISSTGTVVYVPGSAAANSGAAELVYVSRSGDVTALEPRLTYNASPYRSMSLSPDGSRVVLDVVGSAAPDLWVKTLPSGRFSRLTFETLGAVRGSWTPDGNSITYLAQSPGGHISVYKRRSDGSSAPELVVTRNGGSLANQAFITPNGEYLVYAATPSDANRDLYAMKLNGDTTSIPLLTSPFIEEAATISPDSKWIAYTSNESGTKEIFVRPFPNTDAGHWQVSAHGGTAARWSHSGRELFFTSPAGELMAVDVHPGATFDVGDPHVLFNATNFVPSIDVPYYAVTPDGSRFLMVRIAPGSQSSGISELVVVDNWFTELKAKMGRK